VVDTLYVDLIERYAQAGGAERKDVVNLACHECFERRDYLPQHATEEGPLISRRKCPVGTRFTSVYESSCSGRSVMEHTFLSLQPQAILRVKAVEPWHVVVDIPRGPSRARERSAAAAPPASSLHGRSGDHGYLIHHR
jgi:hypothetical protein